jgi:hypothetical protein
VYLVPHWGTGIYALKPVASLDIKDVFMTLTSTIAGSTKVKVVHYY